MVDTREKVLREKLWRAMEIFRRSKLFIHTKNMTINTPQGSFELPEVVGLAILNAIVGNGSMILYGGYGYGKTTFLKYLGRILTGESLDEIEASILRSNPQLTEEKIVARLHLGKLISGGEEQIIWRRFIKTFWKIIDEINRLSPGAQDVILSLLGEGIAKYFDKVYQAPRYVLYATLNPRDVGTFPIGLPLLDRFGIAVIVESPPLDDVIDIACIPDEKFFKRVIPTLLSTDELVSIWGYVETMPLSEDARLFVSMLVKELSLCDRVNKETGIFMSIGSKICTGCHYEELDTVCKIVYTPLSIRAQKDLIRYSKALAWLLGFNEVSLEAVVALAPYVLWHRLKFSEKHLERKSYNRFELTKEIVNIVLRNFLQRLPLMKSYENIKRGIIDPSMVTAIRNAVTNDLVIKYDVAPFVDELLEERYIAYAKQLLSAIEKRDRKAIKAIFREAEEKLSNRQYNALRQVYENELNKRRKVIITSFATWREKIESMSKLLKSDNLMETLKPPKSMFLELDDGNVEIYTVDSKEESPVFLVTYTLWDEFIEKISEVLGVSNATHTNEEKDK